jgi:uncharacterized damage-inducible protein DinB
MAQPVATPKQQFLDTFVSEHATTMKVLHAFPAAQGDFKPHPRSNSARDLAWTFAMEQALLSAAMTDTLKITGAFPKAEGDFSAIVKKFDSDFKALVELIKKTPDSRFNDGTVNFFVAPKTMGDIPVGAFCWFTLCDQIHHRGQLSVYVRMAGGKVPSIYGPSADEAW